MSRVLEQGKQCSSGKFRRKLESQENQRAPSINSGFLKHKTSQWVLTNCRSVVIDITAKVASFPFTVSGNSDQWPPCGFCPQNRLQIRGF